MPVVGTPGWRGLILGSAATAVPSILLPGTRMAAAAYLAGIAMIAAGLVRGARTLSGPERRAWLPWIAGVGCAIGGAAVWQTGLLLGLPLLAEVTPVLWLAFYAPVTLAILRMIEDRALPRAAHVAIAQDVAVVTVAAALFAWHLMIRPALSAATTVDEWDTIAAVCFPLGDVTLLALGLTLLLTPGRRSGSGHLIIASLGGALVVDLTNALLPAAAETAMFWYMPCYMILNALLAAAVLHPDRAAMTEAAPRSSEATGMRGWRFVLLGTALCGVGLSALVVPDRGWDKPLAAAAMIVMIAVILSRLHRAVTDLERAERALRHQATHDQLTGLANRARLMDDLQHAVPYAPTLFFVDLDGFKAVNDTHGHQCGDAVLIAVGERLTGIVRDGDTVARLGGDEFLVVCTGLTEAGVPALADRIERTLRQPIVVDGVPVTIGASIGILTVPAAMTGQETDQLIGDLLRAADDAMYEAKRGGGGSRIATL